MRVGIAALVAAPWLWLAGCATPVEGPGGAEESGAVHGYLSVERNSPWEQQGQGARDVAFATFLRVQEATDPSSVARLVGAVPELPAEGVCRELNVQEATSMPLRTMSPVELLRVGEVTVRSGTSAGKLVTRAYPDVAHLVSGVVYTSSGRESPGASGPVTFEVGGAEGVPGFSVEVPMPPVIEKLTMNGVEVGEGQEWLAVGDAVELRWQAPQEDVSLPPSLGTVVEPDRFFVDVSVIDGRKSSRTLRCSGGAEARLQVPLQITDQTQAVTLTAHHLRTVRLTEGQIRNEIRLDAARSATVRLGEGEGVR